MTFLKIWCSREIETKEKYNPAILELVRKTEGRRGGCDFGGAYFGSKAAGQRGRKSYAGNVLEVEVRWLLMALPDPQSSREDHLQHNLESIWHFLRSMRGLFPQQYRLIPNRSTYSLSVTIQLFSCVQSVFYIASNRKHTPSNISELDLTEKLTPYPLFQSLTS